MRSRTCHGAALPALLAACETVPETLKLEVDGHSVEVKKKPTLPGWTA